MRPVEDFSMIKKRRFTKNLQSSPEKNEQSNHSTNGMTLLMKFIPEADVFSQIKEIDIKCIFALDQLPVSFGSELELTEEGSPDRIFLNQAIDQLAKIFWQNSGFRFRREEANTQYLYHTYLCCQDARLNLNSKNEFRDRGQMERFECASILSFRPSLNERTLNLRYHHKHHTTYDDIHMTPEI
ncbi:hypothetical protein K3495_g8530 [Podosphaera aphanis]|nr:hypothetical protein K3495_g8530 [Podosphaera aphanis]